MPSSAVLPALVAYTMMLPGGWVPTTERTTSTRAFPGKGIVPAGIQENQVQTVACPLHRVNGAWADRLCFKKSPLPRSVVREGWWLIPPD
ncbi:MAG: hypothetical protein MZV63_07255 [Marinilabiliales bacterium]|nr:hypothetical protein [Marinilabiliales bacterium]